MTKFKDLKLDANDPIRDLVYNHPEEAKKLMKKLKKQQKKISKVVNFLWTEVLKDIEKSNKS